MSRSKGDIERDINGAALDGSMTATDPQRARRGSQAEQSFSQRFYPEHFKRNDDGQAELTLADDTTDTRSEHLDFMRRHAADGDNPAPRDTSSAAGTPVYASVTEAFALNEWMFMVWPPPPDLDRTVDAVIDMGVIERNGTANPKMSWDLSLWAWQAGEDLTRDADMVVQSVNISMAGRDVDTRAGFTIPAALLAELGTSLKMKLTRVAASSGDPTGVGVHEIILTYGVTRRYHQHRR